MCIDPRLPTDSEGELVYGLKLDHLTELKKSKGEKLGEQENLVISQNKYPFPLSVKKDISDKIPKSLEIYLNNTQVNS